ncbi:hypothetical protein OG530_19160 [Streptomyces decoyicus]|uniref:hypothetical protein n=1 Tax=Streptomyces decoyicus TaxID=249567 RepID=UPI002E190CF3
MNEIAAALFAAAFVVVGAGVPLGVHFVLLDRRQARLAAIRAERLARPAEAAPLIQACCEMWWLTRGRAHERTCSFITEETDR